ncbi:RNA-dependent RNA polymerase [Papaya mild mottle associated virus]|uniref:RNA-dependent RNA polymerase n=1 Tax=Papaya mild mottle associated virus TaxID=2716617 RepID=A0AAE6X3F7_9VIRU|nr:RNA-dependent RNA polymerase [Papaya mild mottle associated virus]QIJ97072.1 RNA-dependent RNA polymerase [Papaya mild mottle associated virus]
MALTYKTPMEDIVSSFEPAVQAAIATTAANGYKALEEANFNISNFHLNAIAKQKLSSAGIYLSPFSAVVHSHPVCKILENHLLYRVLPSYINNKFFFVGIKSNKLAILKKRNPNLSLINSLNRYVTSADKARYSNDFVVRSTQAHESLQRHKSSLSDITLRDLVPNLLSQSSKHLFLHDELHYWRKRDLITFLEVFNPEVLLATVVIPPEILIGAKKSLNPWCYEFDIIGNKLLFYPDGERSEGYEQPLACSYLLRTSKIILPNGQVYKLDLLCSKFAHHLISITKGDSVTPSFRNFGRFEAVSMNQLKNLTNSKVAYLPVCFEVVSKLFRYLESLKKPDMQSAMAKLSQIVAEPTADEIKFAQEFSKLVIQSNNVNSIITPERLKSCLANFYQCALPKWLSDSIGIVKDVSLDNFIRNLKPLSISVKLQTIQMSDLDDIFDFNGLGPDDSFDLPNALEEGFCKPQIPQKLHELSSPYQSQEADLVCPRALLEIPERHLVSGLAKLYRSRFISIGCRKISRNDVKAFIIDCCSRNRFFFGLLSLELNSRPLDEFTGSVVKHIYAIQIRYVKPFFYEIGIRWFFEYSKFNIQFITNHSEDVGVSFELKKSWSLIVQDLLGRKGKQFIKTNIDDSLKASAGLIQLKEASKPECSCNTSCININASTINFSELFSFLPENGIFSFLRQEDQAYPSGTIKMAWGPKLDEILEVAGMPNRFNVGLLGKDDETSTTFVETGLNYYSGERFIVNISGKSAIEYSCSETDHKIELGPSQGFLLSQACGKSVMPSFSSIMIPKITLVFFHSEFQTKGAKVEESVDSVSSSSNSEGDDQSGNDNKDQSPNEFPTVFNEPKLASIPHNMQFPDKMNKRRAVFYSRTGDSYSYNGGTHHSAGWPEFLNAFIATCGLEPTWFDHCLAQKYSIRGKINFHADNESCYPIRNPILTINLTGRASFGILENQTRRSLFKNLKDNDFFIMPFDFQKSYRHSVRSLTEGRISLTFRSTQPMSELLFVNRFQSLHSKYVEPQKCVESEESVFLASASIEEDHRYVRSGLYLGLKDYLVNFFELSLDSLNDLLASASQCRIQVDNPSLNDFIILIGRENLMTLAKFVYSFPYELTILCPAIKKSLFISGGISKKETFYLEFLGEEAGVANVLPANLCSLQAIAANLGRKVSELLAVINRIGSSAIKERLNSGSGLLFCNLEELFNIFSINAQVQIKDETLIFNSEGQISGAYRLDDSHLTFLAKKKNPSLEICKQIDVNKQFTKEMTEKIRKCSDQIQYIACISRAECLADSLHSGQTGVLLSELFNSVPNFRDLFKKRAQYFPVETNCILGTFGSGKSTFFRSICGKAFGLKFDIVTPRKMLLQEFHELLNIGRDNYERRKRGQENWSISTFERFIKRVPFLTSGQVVFVDEVQLYPPGYLDLIFSLAVDNITWVLLGDPCQSDYYNEKDQLSLSLLASNVDNLLNGKEYHYNILSRRFTKENFTSRLPCQMNFGNHSFMEPYLILEGLDHLQNLSSEFCEAILVSSFEEKKIVETYCKQARKIMTFGESTGLTFQNGTIVVTLISDKSSEKRWITALSRFRKNICIVNCTGYTLNSLVLTYQERTLGHFLKGTASPDQLRKILPGTPKFVDSFDGNHKNYPPQIPAEPSLMDMVVGKDEGVREEKLVGDPWLKSMIDLFQIEDVQEIEMQEIEEVLPNFKIHLPREELEGTRARWVHRILAKEFREVRFGSIVSNQFTDDHSKQKGAIQLTNAAERFETIYPRHRANDTVTFLMAVKRRLRFSKPHVETSKLNMAKPYGRFLLDTFLKKVPLKRHHDHQMFNQAKQDFFDKKTSKSAATIENHNIRSCRDWLIDMTQVFSKSQLCTKFDNRFRAAKAAQSIVCFQHSVLCRFAPYMRYIEMKLKESLPKKFYIHSGKGLDELNKWVIANKFDGVCTESDYEAFDASQDHYIVAFELEIMKFFGLPNDLIKDYEFIKTHLGSKLGSFAIMRFTGEASTFLFNTMANMLFTFLRYNLKGNESICFAGDDMCSSKKLTISRTNENFLSKIKLKAKVQHTTSPTFCGWHLSPEGIYKKPQLVFERMCVAKELNNLHNCIDNYAIEISYAYKKGEAITQRMNEEELGAYYGCVRTIIKHKHLLKSDIRKLYENVELP